MLSEPVIEGMTEAVEGERCPATRRGGALFAVLALLGCLVAGPIACSDDDLFIPGEIPIPPTGVPTATGDPTETPTPT